MSLLSDEELQKIYPAPGIEKYPEWDVCDGCPFPLMACEAKPHPPQVTPFEAMGIDWMATFAELKEAIPPAYTEYIGKYLMKVLVNGEGE
jgi:hypothetical protein